MIIALVSVIYSKLGHQGSKGTKYIGLHRVSPYILNSIYGVCGGHRMSSHPQPKCLYIVGYTAFLTKFSFKFISYKLTIWE